MTVDLSYRVDFAWVEPWSKTFYLYKHLVTWATVHCDRRGLKWQFWSRLHPVRNWKNGQAWSVSTIHLLLKVGQAYLGRTWWLLAQRGHEGHPTNCPELLEHGHNPGVAAPKKNKDKKMATILGWLHLTASWRGVLPHRSSTSRSTYIFDLTLYWIYWIYIGYWEQTLQVSMRYFTQAGWFSTQARWRAVLPS